MPAEVMLRSGKGGRIWMSTAGVCRLLLGSGPMLIGHAHPEVTAAVQSQLPHGTTYSATTATVSLAKAIVDAVPCADQVRFVCSGTEADLYAMRAVRAFRKRDKILKFEGGYHGMSDYALMSLAPKNPGNFRAPFPSAGIPKSVADDAGGRLQRPRDGRSLIGAQGRARRRDRRAVPAPAAAQARLL
jgi:glutamate-1-semialdehyde 2,1-aminomutase